MLDAIDTWSFAIHSDSTLSPAALKIADVLTERFHQCPNLVTSARILVDAAGCLDEKGLDQLLGLGWLSRKAIDPRAHTKGARYVATVPARMIGNLLSSTA
jgi:hypothetical protein